jgi:hypothetical protein
LASLPAVFRNLCQELEPLAGKTFGRLLQDPNTNIAAIRKIKNYSKKLIASAKSEAENNAATAVYYGAIASALVFHDQTITRLSYSTLTESFSGLVEHKWLTPDLAELYERACKYCMVKADPEDPQKNE